SRPIVGRAMLTTVASSEAIPEPSTVIASTQRPGTEEEERAGASAVVMSRQLRSLRGLSYGLAALQARPATRGPSASATRRHGPAWSCPRSCCGVHPILVGTGKHLFGEATTTVRGRHDPAPRRASAVFMQCCRGQDRTGGELRCGK